MKLLAWIFDVTNRHMHDIFRYERGKKGVRIATMILSVIFLLLAVAAELLFFDLFYFPPSDEYGLHILKLIGAGTLAFGFAYYTVEYCGCFSFIAFKMAIFGVIFSADRRARYMKKKNILDSSEPIENAENYKKLDLFVGFFELIMAIGSIILFAWLLFKYPDWFLK